MEVTLRQLRYFIAAANAGQVSQAAMNINVSQSAITNAIKALEDVIGASLFDRHASGVSLTLEGNQFLDRARRIIESLDEAIRLPCRSRNDVKGTLELAVSYTVAGYFIPPYIARFSRAYPDVAVNLVEADRGTIEENIIGGGFDLAVMLTSNIVNDDKLVHKTLLRSRRRLWVGANHRFLDQPTVALKDVSAEPYIMLTVDEASNTAQRYWCRTPYRPDTAFRTSSVEAVRSMVANDMGVTVLSDMVYRPWSLEGRRIRALEISDEVPTMDIGLVWSEDSSLNKPAKAFIDFMHLAIGADHVNAG